MRISKLKISQYKNLNKVDIDLHPSINAFTGLNGMGKTNILDAIHYLCLAKSNFGRLERNNVMLGKDFFRLEGAFVNMGKKHDIVIKVKPPRLKVVEKNKKALKKIADYIGEFPVVIIAPRDKNALLESSKERRKFMDRALSQTDKTYLNSLLEYNKILKQRNALLKNNDFGNIDTLLLDTYDKRLAPLVDLIYGKRKAFVKDILPDFLGIYAEIASESEVPNLSYITRFDDNNYQRLVKDSFQKDIILKRSTVGIHKDDLGFELNGKSLKYFASQGQLKSYALATKLAEYSFLKKVKGFEPIVILDDVFDKLDKTRVKKLVSLLFKENFGQVFISDTDRKRVEGIFQAANVEYKIFEVKEGNINNSSKIDFTEKGTN